MFKKHWPKFIPTFLILFIFLAGMVYRGIFRAPLNKNVVASFPHYTIKELDGQYYFRPLVTENNIIYHSYLGLPTPKFDSPEQMRSSILNGQLTQVEADTVFYATSTVDQEGDLYICDLDHLYMPILTGNLTINSVTWNGISYSYALHDGSMFPHNLLHVDIHGNKRSYEEAFEDQYQYPLDVYERHLLRTEVDPDTKGTIYQYSVAYPNKIRCYELDSKSGILSVLEHYDEGKTIPNRLYFFGCHNGIYFTGSISRYILNTYWNDIPNILQSLQIIPVSPAES